MHPGMHQKQFVPYKEAGPNGEPSIEPILKTSKLKFARDIRELVEHSEIIFVAIQTPHEKRYEGITRLPSERHNIVSHSNYAPAISDRHDHESKEVPGVQ